MSAQWGPVGIRRPVTDHRPPLCENHLQHSDEARDQDDAGFDAGWRKWPWIRKLCWNCRSELGLIQFHQIQILTMH